MQGGAGSLSPRASDWRWNKSFECSFLPLRAPRTSSSPLSSLPMERFTWIDLKSWSDWWVSRDSSSTSASAAEGTSYYSLYDVFYSSTHSLAFSPLLLAYF